MDRFEAETLTQMLVVADAAVSRDWYVDVLEASVYGEYGGTSVVLDLMGSWLLLVTGGEPSPEKPTVTLTPPNNPDRVSTQVIFRVADCQRTYELLSSRGAEFLTPPLDRGGEIRACFRDLDGHLFEISQLIQARSPVPSAVERIVMVEFCRARLAHFKCPTGMTIIDEIRRNATRRALHRKVRDRLAIETWSTPRQFISPFRRSPSSPILSP